MTDGDEELMARLRGALGGDDDAEPSADRIASVRAAAESARAGTGSPAAEGAATVTPLPVRPARHGRRQVIAGAAAAAVGLVAGASLWEAGDEDPEPGPPTEALDLAVPAPGVVASGKLINHEWGVELILEGTGFASGGSHLVAFTGVDGTRTPAGGFVGVGTTAMVCRCTGTVLRKDLVALEVVGPEGAVVARAALS